MSVTGCAPKSPEMIAFSGPTMGTMYNVKFVLDDIQAERINTEQIDLEIKQSLQQINNLMSTYINDSELSRLNKAPAGVPFRISAETEFVLAAAIELHHMSMGALDITVGPLVNLWGFGPTMRPNKVPTNEDVEEVRQFVGLDKFQLNDRAVIKSHPDVYIDLSTIAKGYAVDEIAALLESYHITNYLVDIGGEMRISGKKSEDKDWLIAIEKPVTNQRAAQVIISIGDNAIATSGDYRNYFEKDGIRYSHLIDPSTAKPIQHNLAAVSVIHKSSMMADGLATALIVMGKEKGLAFAESENIPALFVVKEGEDFVEYHSTAFDKTVSVMH